ncbi:MAG: MoxR family ATPase [Verrucomicrobiae bacterium]|nr:MoxR family ATPase [Verrucomicrobiae bacterium]
MEIIQKQFERLKGELAKVIIGQDKMVEQAVVAFFAGGHVLLEGVPGLAKTLFAKALAQTLSAQFKRIQFTPDLMPSDIIGTNVFNLDTRQFTLMKGPIFTDLLLADEVNRTPPKTQAALLEAMEERQITIDGHPHLLSPHFFVIATQNPLEYEGTFPLPEAQTDRFLMKITVTYPEAADELEVLKRHHEGFNPIAAPKLDLQQVLKEPDVKAIQQAATKVKVDAKMFDYILQIVTTTRRSSRLTLGGSPRASISLLMTSKVLAALRGRDFITPDDVKELAYPVMRHRLILKPEAEIEGFTTDRVIEQVLNEVVVPR